MTLLLIYVGPATINFTNVPGRKLSLINKAGSNIQSKFGKVAIPAFFIILSGCFSCTSKGKMSQASIPADIIKPPDTITISSPVIIQLDTCPKPLKVIIPTEPGEYSMRKSVLGTKMIRSVPPSRTAAGLFVPMINYDMSNGLALTSVNKCLEDTRGNMWIGTSGAGVNCYNGKSFINYNVAHGLAGNIVLNILEDSKGNMWFAAGNGVSCFNGRSFKNYFKEDGLAENGVSAMREDLSGNIWMGTVNGVSRFNSKTETFTNFTTENGLVSNYVFCTVIDKQGNIWFGTDEGLSVLTSDMTTLPANQVSFLKCRSLDHKWIYDILDDSKGNIWVGTYEGVFRLRLTALADLNESGVTKFTTKDGLPGGIILDVLEDKNHNIWFGSYGSGISRLDEQDNDTSGKMVHFTNYTTAEGLADNSVNSIEEDRNGNLWIGTTGGGVSVLMQAGNCIRTYTTGQGLVDNHVISVAEDSKNNTWFGTAGGLSMLDKEEKYFTSYTTAQGLIDYSANIIMEDRHRNIWFSTEGSGISVMDTNRKTITTYTTAQGLVNNYPLTMLEVHTGSLWIGTTGGLSHFDGKTFTNYTTLQGLVGDAVVSLLEDTHGNLWIGTLSGLSYFDGKHFINYVTAQGLPYTQISNELLEDREGNIWFGVKGGGLARFDGKSFKIYSTADGLPDNYVISLAMDKENNIWIGTNKGFTVLKGFVNNIEKTSNPNGQTVIKTVNNLSNTLLSETGYRPAFEIFNIQTGYQVKDMYKSLFITRAGIIWAGNGDKLVRFNPAAVHKNPDPLTVYIQKIRVNNEDLCWNDLQVTTKSHAGNDGAKIAEEASLFTRALTEAQREAIRQKYGDIKFDSITPFYPVPVNLVLPYRFNNITIDFAAIEPARPKLVQYQYLLEGYNYNWSPVSNESTASFGNIHEGSYAFKVKVRSPDGVWSEALVYTFKVLPPWYRSWWAYTIYAVCFITLLWSFIRWRLSVLKKEKVRLEEKIAMQNAVMDERSRISRELHDEVGATLSGIAMYSHLAKEQVKSSGIPGVENSLNIMQQSASEMVTKLNDIVWLVNPAHDSIQKLVQKLEDYANDMCHIKDIHVKVNVIADLSETKLSMDTRHHIYLFCKEAINNAVKYSEGTSLELSVKEINGMLEFSVADNGKGFNEAAIRRGNGLNNMQKRAEEIGATVILETKYNMGSKLCLRVKT